MGLYSFIIDVALAAQFDAYIVRLMIDVWAGNTDKVPFNDWYMHLQHWLHRGKWVKRETLLKWRWSSEHRQPGELNLKNN